MNKKIVLLVIAFCCMALPFFGQELSGLTVKDGKIIYNNTEYIFISVFTAYGQTIDLSQAKTVSIIENGKTLFIDTGKETHAFSLSAVKYIRTDIRKNTGYLSLYLL